MTARFAASIYPGGRMCLLAGNVTVGAVFPPAHSKDAPWSWRVWITADGHARDGQAKSETAAKNAALAVWRDFTRAAGLTEDQE